MKATAEYATAKIAVWWDMKDCPIPEGYDSCRIRKILEGAFEEQGYSGPVSITAYGDQTETPGYILQGLFSTGVSVAHTRSESKNHLMYRDMVEWRGQNAPPATMMIISDLVAKGNQFSWDLVRQQQRTLYNLFLAYSVRPQGLNNVLSTSEEWCRNKLLKNKLSGPLVVVQGAKFYCKSCNFDSQSPEKFRKHLSSYKHAREEDVNHGFEKVRRYTEDWRRNYKATPEFATAKIQVLWDMFDCPIPEGYDARQVRPSIEAAFKDLGYSGPVSITAYGYHKHTPLQALSSTGVDVVHTVPGRGQSDINFHQREEPDVRRGNVCFGVEEDEAAAHSLEAPRRESRSASTSQSKPSVKMTNRNKVTSPTDLHVGDGFGCDGDVKSPLTAPSGTGEAIGAREKGGARLGLRGNFGGA
ncbi:PREDICTED: uncharacterized protein LOC106330533 [Brassica oleracea var. oleracea]|uniref:uncharacterized protein LOC106330533 n=1 Tax=Brassica oleracea var. oleracea TaxID=109376 RepID=UPI0006A755A5|nr:PREDICTED: uncharacterized protein LOC106330533 [Brassica oleracea var. oleracea]